MLHLAIHDLRNVKQPPRGMILVKAKRPGQTGEAGIRLGQLLAQLGRLEALRPAHRLQEYLNTVVSQRRMEIGIRTALGAAPRDLFGVVMRQTGWLTGCGALGGLASGFAVMPLAASIFYGIAPVEPLAMAGAACGASAIVVITTYGVVRPWTRLTAMDLLRQ